MSELPLQVHIKVWKRAMLDYGNSFRAESREESGEKGESTSEERRASGAQASARGGVGEAEEETPSMNILDEIAATARAGKGRAAPALSEMYERRIRAYRDALREFIASYREAYKEAYETETAAGHAEETAAREGASPPAPDKKF
eukprot:CAMPEP_0170150908 /NCGR_PEP_ID=MMETSP0033_2-20121228/47970_1 /TAXON_ID=195969 /ORGANISM="Dolichomastix tenuilepis, Strain CCMP3274" /LENGTH=144 /DNA_ID=CAMNT_0010387977 /DNA_START=58 /DNA_END=492 /DNA_ORIENTATION=+